MKQNIYADQRDRQSELRVMADASISEDGGRQTTINSITIHTVDNR